MKLDVLDIEDFSALKRRNIVIDFYLLVKQKLKRKQTTTSQGAKYGHNKKDEQARV